jgi:hypothetical protein
VAGIAVSAALSAAMLYGAVVNSRAPGFLTRTSTSY